MEGKILSICVSPKKGAKKDEVHSALFIADWGIKGDAHAGCQIQRSIGKCIMPKKGIFAKVLAGGRIEKNDFFKIQKQNLKISANI